MELSSLGLFDRRVAELGCALREPLPEAAGQTPEDRDVEHGQPVGVILAAPDGCADVGGDRRGRIADLEDGRIEIDRESLGQGLPDAAAANPKHRIAAALIGHRCERRGDLAQRGAELMAAVLPDREPAAGTGADEADIAGACAGRAGGKRDQKVCPDPLRQMRGLSLADMHGGETKTPAFADGDVAPRAGDAGCVRQGLAGTHCRISHADVLLPDRRRRPGRSRPRDRRRGSDRKPSHARRSALLPARSIPDRSSAPTWGKKRRR